jgi:hypothetical protein
MKMINTITLVIVLATLTFNINAMPGEAHDRLGKKILSQSTARGGAAGLMPQQVESINRWMDNPATKTGEYMNRSVDQLVCPRNHGILRHNPDSVSRALSGTGEINPAIKNVARVHKIADIAHNTSPVDGWKPAGEMKRGAQQMISHVETHNSLPQKLPKWVDEAGPLAKAKLIAKPATKITKAAPVVGFVVEAAIRGRDAYQTEQEYRQGEISAHERGVRHAENAGGMAGGIAGASAGAAAGAAIGAPFGGIGAVPGAAIGAFIGLVGGGIAGDALGSKGGRAIYEWTSE